MVPSDTSLDVIHVQARVTESLVQQLWSKLNPTQTAVKTVISASSWTDLGDSRNLLGEDIEELDVVGNTSTFLLVGKQGKSGEEKTNFCPKAVQLCSKEQNKQKSRVTTDQIRLFLFVFLDASTH